MPLAAHAHWLGTSLELHAALGNAANPQAPLLRATQTGPVTDDSAALAMGRSVAAGLRTQGADAYLAAGAQAALADAGGQA